LLGIAPEIRVAYLTLRELRRQSQGAFVFASELGGPMTRFNVSKMIEAAGRTRRATVCAPAHAQATRVGICWPMRGMTLGDCKHTARIIRSWAQSRSKSSGKANHGPGGDFGSAAAP